MHAIKVKYKVKTTQPVEKYISSKNGKRYIKCPRETTVVPYSYMVSFCVLQ